MAIAAAFCLESRPETIDKSPSWATRRVEKVVAETGQTVGWNRCAMIWV
jgi:hypothetical protein